ncbi:MAG: ferritin-like domain-containing protein [Gammaproteobacteria bacterium]|nr:ferritin-like domain-containing protein [Gammaproteobacteria bacterium]
MNSHLFDAAAECLDARDPGHKASLTHNTARRWSNGELDRVAEHPAKPEVEAGIPERPVLVPPRKLHSRKLQTREGHAALIHSICHIEFNAINLAWDAVYRFRDMPTDFYDGWVRVADEEATHFEMLRQHLNSLGFDYGDFDAHNGLWEMAQKTAHDPLVRMALVPRVLEARGLDVTPAIMEKLSAVGDDSAVAILELILRDEVGHVEIGSHWFQYLCRQRGQNPEPTFRELLKQYMKGRLKGPFHKEARLRAGFSEQELAYLEGIG